MGANTFDKIIFGKNASNAYIKAKKEADEEYGHQEGYSGQINSTNSVEQITVDYRYNTKNYNKLVDEKLNNINKRECLLIEITGKAAKDLKEKNGLKGSHDKVYHALICAAE